MLHMKHPTALSPTVEPTCWWTSWGGCRTFHEILPGTPYCCVDMVIMVIKEILGQVLPLFDGFCIIADFLYEDQWPQRPSTAASLYRRASTLYTRWFPPTPMLSKPWRHRFTPARGWVFSSLGAVVYFRAYGRNRHAPRSRLWEALLSCCGKKESASFSRCGFCQHDNKT